MGSLYLEVTYNPVATQNYMMKGSLMNDLAVRTRSVVTSTGFLGKIRDNFLALWIGSPENRVYGNSAILSHFAGSNSRLVFGRLQHGWASHANDGLYYKNNLLPTFVWSKESESAAAEKGWKNFFAIGAPWLYLLQILDSDGWGNRARESSRNPERTLWVYGLHSLEPNGAEKERLLQFLSEANDSARTGDLCLLYYEDFDALSIDERQAWNNLQIVTLGQRSSSVISDAHLIQLFHILSSVGRLSIDHPSTLVLYALSLDVKIKWIKNETWTNACEWATDLESLELHQLLTCDLDTSTQFKPFALKKLGVGAIKSRTELNRMLFWDGPSSYFKRKVLMPFKLIPNSLYRFFRDFLNWI